MDEQTNITLTKWILFKKTLLPFVVLFTCFGLGFGLLIQLITLFSNDPLTWRDSLLTGLEAFIAIFILGTVLCAYGPFRQTLYISTQERALNFSFSDEMLSKGITEFNYQDDLWFIFTERHQILVLRRDFVNRIKRVKDHSREGSLRAVKIERFDGKEMKIIASEEGMKNFRKWYLRK